MSDYLRHTDDKPCPACVAYRAPYRKLARLALAVLPGGLLVLGLWWAWDKYRSA
jgi:hypothetical protein